MYRNSIYNIPIPLYNDKKILLYNTVSRAFVTMEESDKLFLENINDGTIPIDEDSKLLLDRLILNGFVIPNDIDELDRIEKSYLAFKNDENSLMLTIAPTLSCNFACDYCFQGSDKPKEKMSRTVMDAIVAYVQKHIAKIKSFHVSWYGGEPLMGFSTIEKLSKRFIEICDANNVTYSAAIITNGYDITASVAENLKLYRVNTVQITLDGAEDYHNSRRYLLSKKGTFNKIIENIVSWINTDSLAVSLRINIDTRNRDSMFKLIDQLESYGLAGKKLSVYFAPVESTTSGCSQIVDFTLGKSEFAELETELFLYAYQKKLAKFPFPPRFMGVCGAVRPKALVITPNGELHKCWDTVTYPHQCVGQISAIDELETNPINEMWNSWSPFNNDSCRNCKLLPSCAGACGYKFIHSSETRGEAATLPCPSWKYNIKEKLLYTAYLNNFITKEQIPKGIVTIPSEFSFNYSMEKEYIIN